MYSSIYWRCSRHGLDVRSEEDKKLHSHKKDIYSDICGDTPAPQKFSGSWKSSLNVGGCNACYGEDNHSTYAESVFEFNAHGLIVRLCQGHLRELVKQSRYK